MALILCAAALLVWAAGRTLRSPGAAPLRINGAYTITLAGSGSGTGRAVVTPQRVKIDGTFTDSRGNRVVLSAPDLTIDRSTYRFSGQGSLGSAALRISGRLDPDDGTLGKCRISATFLASDGNAGRLVGAHN